MFQNAVPYSCSSDSDEEPVTKQPRLSRGRSRGSGTESSGQSARSARAERAKRVVGRSRSEYRDHPVSRTDPSDSDASSENRSIDEGSYFEVRNSSADGQLSSNLGLVSIQLCRQSNRGVLQTSHIAPDNEIHYSRIEIAPPITIVTA